MQLPYGTHWWHFAVEPPPPWVGLCMQRVQASRAHVCAGGKVITADGPPAREGCPANGCPAAVPEVSSDTAFPLAGPRGITASPSVDTRLRGSGGAGSEDTAAGHTPRPPPMGAAS